MAVAYKYPKTIAPTQFPIRRIGEVAPQRFSYNKIVLGKNGNVIPIPTPEIPSYDLPTNLARPGQIAPDPAGAQRPLGEQLLDPLVEKFNDNSTNLVTGIIGLLLIIIAFVQIVKPI